MKQRVVQRVTPEARRVALAYFVLAASWILLSDRAVGYFFSDPQLIERVSMIKGWLFVGVTAVLLYFAVRRLLLLASAESETRQLANDALRESEERYRLLAENIADVVWVIDPEAMRLVYISPSVERLRGLTAAEVLARPLMESFPKDQQGEFVQRLRRRVESFAAGDPAARTQRFEHAVVAKDGREVVVEAVTSLVRDASGALRLIGVSRSIDERLRVERELRESEERFRAVVETAPIAIFIQAHGCFAYLNPKAIELFGATHADQLLGRPVVEVFHPDCRAAVAERIRRLDEQREGLPEMEQRILRGDSSEADGAFSAVPFDYRGMRGALVFGRDITEEKRARQQLEFHEAVLRETGEIAKVGGWNFNPATGRGYWSEEVARIHELDIDTPTSVELGLGFYQGESRRRIEEALAAAIGQGTPYDLSLELVTARGNRKWVRTIGHPLVENGKVVLIRGSFQDVTELYEATEALRASEARFRELAETINEVFWITDPEKRRVLYVSPAYERIWGRPCASLLAAPGDWIETVHPDDRGRVAEALVHKQAAGTYDETYRIVRPDGEVRTVQDRAYPVRSADGSVVRVVGVAEDVTDAKRLEAQFLRTQRLEAIGALAGGIAHDLNNILTPVLMSVGLLRGEEEEAKRLELITVVEQCTNRGAEVIRQLLAFSRGVDGKRVVVQPRHLIREMVSIIRETFPRSISLEVDVGADLWPVEANSTQLHQVLMNLCVNARDAMPAGGQLTIAARNLNVTEAEQVHDTELKVGPHVVIEVIDSGEGMSSETMARIFEPFFTSKAPGKGTGLGLSTALGIVRSHGGRMAVYSEVGRGSRFRVYLPATPQVTVVPEVRAVEVAKGNGELVLVVDDEKSVRDSIGRLLAENGYRVRTAENGERALAEVALTKGDLRVVITDVMMPVMDGIAFCRSLRSLDPGVGVVATSGLEDTGKREALAALGVQEFLGKPCEGPVVLAAVRRALEAGRA